MTTLALALLLVAAVLHATWNYAAKLAGGGLPFVYLVGLMICTLYVPVLGTWFYLHPPTGLDRTAVLWVLGSGVLKTGYSLFLQRGYRTGDFSLIYPLARGTGPLLSTLAAIVLLGERPGAVTLLGGAIIVGSIFWLTGGIDAFRRLLAGPNRGATASAISSTATSLPAAAASLRYGILSGLFIAAYTVWDRQGVSLLAIAPVVYDGGTAFTQLALLTPFAWKRRRDVRHEARVHWKNAVVMATLSPLGYVLVLTALSFTPVSTIAPAREISIVIGAFFGVRLLKESHGRRRLLAAALMVAGIVLLALGHTAPHAE